MKKGKFIIAPVLAVIVLLVNALPGLCAMDPAQFELEQRILQYDREKLTLVKEVLKTGGFLFFSGTTQEIDWSVWQGAAAYLTDEEFLKLVGDEELYKKVATYNRRVKTASTGLLVLGGTSLLASSGAPNDLVPALFVVGMISVFAGFFIHTHWGEDRHWISAEDAAQRVEAYNNKLLRKLSLTPADVAYPN